MITNVSKPTTTLTNTDKVAFAELWSTISTTWATETRTWGDCASLISNATKATSYALWSVFTFPWQEDAPWADRSTMTNIAKP